MTSVQEIMEKCKGLPDDLAKDAILANVGELLLAMAMSDVLPPTLRARSVQDCAQFLVDLCLLLEKFRTEMDAMKAKIDAKHAAQRLPGSGKRFSFDN